MALVAPAGPMQADRLAASVERCRALGLDPRVYPSAEARVGYLAGTDARRLADLQAAFDDPEVDAVWALRGGYGTLRILAGLDLGRQLRDPIPFIGFSDNTTLHTRQVAMGIVSFHGPHPGGRFPDLTEASFRSVLFSAEPAGALPCRPRDPEPATVRPGVAEGPLVGGNLAMLASLCGSGDAPSARGAILCLEDVGEPAYRIDRMLVQLSRGGVLNGVAALACGRFTEVPKVQGAPSAADLIRELADALGVPAVVDLPFGHVDHNCTLPLGARAVLDAREATLTLVEPAVTPR